jgi:hypothetical protein
MLNRALRLKDEIDGWISTNKQDDPALAPYAFSAEEWTHIRYLAVLLRPYALFTWGFSTQHGPTITMAWETYTKIFKHLEVYDELLRRKPEQWKVQLADATSAAHQKLAEYYTRTDGSRGLLYNLACVLDPRQKLERYRSDAFEPKYVKIYEDEVRAFYEAGYAHLDEGGEEEQDDDGQLPTDLASVLAMEGSRTGTASRRVSAIDQYLQSPVVKGVDPLSYWQSQKHIFPGLVQMAMDVLSAPATEVEVERIFSVARQVCPFQRNRMNADTFQQTMIVHQNDKLMNVYDDDDDSDGGDVALAQRESKKLSDGDYISSRGLVISDNEAEEEEEDEQVVRASAKKRTRRTNRR